MYVAVGPDHVGTPVAHPRLRRGTFTTGGVERLEWTWLGKFELSGRICNYISANPQVAATYGTLASAVIALVVATATFRQVRLTRASLDQARRQALTSETALDTQVRQARRDRLNEFAPLVTPVLLPRPEFVIVEEAPDLNANIEMQFKEQLARFDFGRQLKLDRRTLDYNSLDFVWLSGRLLLRNEGSMSAMISPFTPYFCAAEGDDIIEVDDQSFLLEPGARSTIQWVAVFSVLHWMRTAAGHYRDGTDHPLNPVYNFKYLGIQEESHFLSVRRPAIQDLSDDYDASFDFLPLVDYEHETREDGYGMYEIRPDPPQISLRNRIRTYPDAGAVFER